MPIEGLPTESNTPNAASAATTPDAAANNTAADSATGTGTDTAQPNQAQSTEKTFTQADVDRIVANRIKSGVKAELKKLTGESEGGPTVDDLQRQLSEANTKARGFEAREAIRDHLSDARHKLNVKAENIRPIEELVVSRLSYDDEGNPSNLKEAIETVKSLAPTLFANNVSNINANSGLNQPEGPTNMNDWIRGSKAA